MMAAPDNILPVGTTLCDGRYRIDAHLASGGFGNTYRAYDSKFERHVALKEFFILDVNLRQPGHTLVSVATETRRPLFDKMRGRFIDEARRMNALNHPGVVRVIDFFDANGTSYYVMDLVDGESLAAKMKRQGGPMAEAQVEAYLTQLLDALEYVHRHGLLHLDIKPANIMEDSDGRLHLIDFGASRQADAADLLTHTHTAMPYTKGYAPTEQIEGNKKKTCPATDLYALGATLYHLLTGEQPPEIADIGMDKEHAFHFPAEVSARMRGLIIALMQPFPAERPQSVEEVRSMLGDGGLSPTPSNGGDDDITVIERPVAHPQPVRPSKTQPVSEQRKETRSYRVWPWLLMVAGLLLAGGVVWWRTSASDDPSSGSTDDDMTEEVPITDPVLARLIDNMVPVDGGTFWMGANPEDSEAYGDEKPRHQVTLSDFSIGRYEVTQEEWEAVMGSNPSEFKGAKRPVENVSWGDCQEFIRKLNEKTGKQFRLPTEAEWEFAARGGNKSQGYQYSGSNNPGAVAWYYYGNSGNQTHDVGQKSPNELGLYDMSGNVREWCQDWYDDYSSSSQTNPTGPASGSNRVLRGGSCDGGAWDCRVSLRDYYTPDNRYDDLGFRLVL